MDLELTSVSDGTLMTVAVLCAIAMVVGAVVLTPYNRLDGRSQADLPISSLPQRPILQVELARTLSDLESVLMQGNSALNLRDATVGNYIDTFLFIPAYAGFLFAVGLLLSRVSSHLGPIVLFLA